MDKVRFVLEIYKRLIMIGHVTVSFLGRTVIFLTSGGKGEKVRLLMRFSYER